MMLCGVMGGLLLWQGLQQVELQQLQGEWKLVAAESGGLILTIRGNKVLMPNTDDVMLAVNPLAKPKQIDFRFTGGRPVTCPGIYHLDGDVMTVSYRIPCDLFDKQGHTVRPKDFSEVGPCVVNMTMKRVKP